jgi:hypothetical protein
MEIQDNPNYLRMGFSKLAVRKVRQLERLLSTLQR